MVHANRYKIMNDLVPRVYGMDWRINKLPKQTFGGIFIQTTKPRTVVICSGSVIFLCSGNHWTLINPNNFVIQFVQGVLQFINSVIHPFPHFVLPENILANNSILFWEGKIVTLLSGFDQCFGDKYLHYYEAAQNGEKCLPCS